METALITEFIRKSFDRPDEQADFPGASMQSVQPGDLTVTRMVCEPGWRWTDHLPSIIGTDTCEYEHPMWLVLSGRFVVQMNDGRTEEFGPGDLGTIPPGHDAWVAGDEPVHAIDIQMSGRGQGEDG